MRKERAKPGMDSWIFSNMDTPPAAGNEGEGGQTSSEKNDGAVTLDSGHGTIHCMTIIGQIEGHTALPNHAKATKYEHMIPQLAAIEESPEIAGLLIILNTIDQLSKVNRKNKKRLWSSPEAMAIAN